MCFNEAFEENYRILLNKLSEVEYLIDEEAKKEIANAHRMKISFKKHLKIDDYDIPVKSHRKSSINSASFYDFELDPDVKRYNKKTNKIDEVVYNDYSDRRSKGISISETYFNPILTNKLAEDAINKSIKAQRRNQRAMDYDVSGQSDVNFVNDKNKAFNRRLDRSFKKHIDEAEKHD